MGPPELMDKVAANLNRVSPGMAVFGDTRGQPGQLRQGDELVVRMPGPWDGPVRVVHRDPMSFRLATLEGHLEAGEIEFRATSDGDALQFEIESWARARYRLADLLYNRLRLAKEIQLNMWSHFCVRAAALAGGRLSGGVTIRTRRVDWPPPGARAWDCPGRRSGRRRAERCSALMAGPAAARPSDGAQANRSPSLAAGILTALVRAALVLLGLVLLAFCSWASWPG